MQGRVGEARKVLLLEEEAEQRLKEIKCAVGIDENSTQDIVHVPKKTHSGEGGIVFPRIFERAGIVDKSKILLSAIGIGVSKVVFGFIAIFLVDRVGRRILLLVSAGSMVVALLGLGICLIIVENSKGNEFWAIGFSITATYVYIASMSIGVGPVTWVYSSEIFPLRLRAQGLAFCVAMNRITNFIVATSFISIYKLISMGGTFFLLTGINALAWWFYYTLLPETKGRSLEEMEILFGKDSKSEVKMKPTCNSL
ncbi:Sugar/inositol transporter [Sesbania bispinosa]|nr:Sugar/inositol transporter [Sesbania bispinosa]